MWTRMNHLGRGRVALMPAQSRPMGRAMGRVGREPVRTRARSRCAEQRPAGVVGYACGRIASAAGCQARKGGPRGGNGAPTRAAMRASSMGVRACASGCGWLICREAAGAGREAGRHIAQSSVCWPASTTSPFWSVTMSFIVPPSEQINSIVLGATMGDAMATPSVNANHANTRRMSVEDVRRACMFRIMTCIDMIHVILSEISENSKTNNPQ